MAAVGLVDYGMGNLASVERAIRAAAPGLEVVRVTRPAQLGAVRALVLPGVGAFEAAMIALARSGMDEALSAYLQEGRPLLGICLGYQLLFGESEEVSVARAGRTVRGLGWLPGRVRRFPAGMTVPHMGWNRLELTGTPSPLFGPAAGSFTQSAVVSPVSHQGPYVYFAHSYYPELLDPAAAVAWCTVQAEGRPGVRFAAAAWLGSAGGVQFHPEKSGQAGLAVIARFLGWALETEAGAHRPRGAAARPHTREAQRR